LRQQNNNSYPKIILSHAKLGCCSCPARVRQNTAPDRTVWYRIVPNPKVLGDGVHQTPQRTGDPDKPTIPANNSALTPLYSRGVKYTPPHRTPLTIPHRTILTYRTGPPNSRKRPNSNHNPNPNPKSSPNFGGPIRSFWESLGVRRGPVRSGVVFRQRAALS